MMSLINETLTATLLNFFLKVSLEIYVTFVELGGVLVLHLVDVVTVGAIVAWFGYIIQKEYGRVQKEDWQRF